jgi:cell division protein FtsB
MPALDVIRDFAVMLGALVAIFSALYIARNKGILANYKETVESQAKRIDSLEAENADLTKRVVALEGAERGYEFAAEAFIKAASRARICARADCSDYVIPAPDATKHRA